MINAYLVVNKPSIAAEYLEKHNILHIAQYSTSLAGQDLTNTIIDVDKLLYIYYGDVPDDTAFKTDLSVLRTRLESAYFTCRSFMFILVKPREGLEDYIHAALDRFNLDDDKLEIIIHDRELMLPELSNYISGVNIGDTTKNSYINVYVSEAGKEDKERYANRLHDTIDSITPSLVDEAAMYKTRVASLSQTFDAVVSQEEKPKSFVSEMQPYMRKSIGFMDTIIVSGDMYTDYKKAAVYFTEHFVDLGERVFVVNLCRDTFFDKFEQPVNLVDLQQIGYKYVPEKLITYISVKVRDYANIIANEHHLESIKTKIVVVPPEMFELVYKIEVHSTAKLDSVYVLHKRRDSFNTCAEIAGMIGVLVVDTSVFNDSFEISEYRSSFANSSCVLLPSSSEQKHIFYYDCFGKDRGDSDNAEQ